MSIENKKSWDNEMAGKKEQFGDNKVSREYVMYRVK